MQGGEIFVPKVKSMSIVDLAKAIAPDCATRVTGIRPGEKIHEVLIAEDDARNTLEYQDHFVILPAYEPETVERYMSGNGGKVCPDGFQYTSHTNPDKLSSEDLRAILGLNEEGRHDKTA
jgi:UDP-N-acetylglucosamine 4,6-dehydratase